MTPCHAIMTIYGIKKSLTILEGVNNELVHMMMIDDSP